MSVPVFYDLAQKIIAGPLHRRVNAFIASEIPDNPATRVLDVGCGLGNNSLLFSSAHYTGLDVDPAYIAHARKSFSKSNRTFLVGDAISPPQFPGVFTNIFSVGLYHHLSDRDTITSIRRLLPLLAERGSLFVFDAVFPKQLNIVGYILRRLDRGKYVRTYEHYQRLLLAHFKPKFFQYHTAGVLDYVAYMIEK